MGFFSAFTTREFGQGVARAGEQLGRGLEDSAAIERAKKRKELEEKLLELKVEREEEAAKEKLRKRKLEEETTGQLTEFEAEEKRLREIAPVVGEIREDIEFEKTGAAGPTRLGSPEFTGILGPDLGLETPEEKIAPLKEQLSKTRASRLSESPLATKLNDPRVKAFLDFQVLLDDQSSPEFKSLKERGEISGFEGDIDTADAIKSLRRLSKKDKDSLITNKTLRAGFDVDPLGTIAKQTGMDSRIALAFMRDASKSKKESKDVRDMRVLRKFVATSNVLREAATGKGRISGRAAIIRGQLGRDGAAKVLEAVRGIMASFIITGVAGQQRVSDQDVKLALPLTISVEATDAEANIISYILNNIKNSELSSDDYLKGLKATVSGKTTEPKKEPEDMTDEAIDKELNE